MYALENMENQVQFSRFHASSLFKSFSNECNTTFRHSLSEYTQENFFLKKSIYCMKFKKQSLRNQSPEKSEQLF